jgi:hypothetical protein
LLPLAVSNVRESGPGPLPASQEVPLPTCEQDLGGQFLDGQPEALAMDTITEAARQDYISARNDLLVRLLDWIGLDPRKAVHLRLADVLWGRSSLYVRQRGEPGEIIPISRSLREDMYELLQARTAAGAPQKPDSYLFWAPPGTGSCLDIEAVQQRMVRPDPELMRLMALAHPGATVRDLLEDPKLHHSLRSEPTELEGLPRTTGGWAATPGLPRPAPVEEAPIVQPHGSGGPGLPNPTALSSTNAATPLSRQPDGPDLDVLGGAGMPEPDPQRDIGPEL